VSGLAPHVERLVVAGRLDPDEGTWHHPLPDGVELWSLPYYGSLSRPWQPAVATARSLRRFWRLLGEVDCVWLMGPHPFSLAFAVLAALRRRRVAFGVRQDFPRYIRNRHPGRLGARLAAQLLERAFRLAARRARVVAVGPELARHYSRARRLLEITASLVRERSIVSSEESLLRSWEGVVLSVGRLDAEKNPLLLADVLAALRARDGRWRLVVCGEGPLEEALRERLEELRVADEAELRGYVPAGAGLEELYRGSDALLHVSWTEGMPQVLLEAFAAGLPVVATAVGGVAEAAGEAALLVPPGDADAAVSALERLAGEPALRKQLVEAGLERVRGRTLEAQCAAVAKFLAAN
jgi:glycosyltransferase involved in cell wall biosynthesis